MSDTHKPSESSGPEQKIGEIVEIIDEGDLAEVVDIEVFAKENKRPPKAKKYRFRIDRDYFTVETRIVTGQQLFELAKKSPAEYRMHQKLHGGQMKEVRVQDQIDLGEPGIERFTTMKLTEGDGEQPTATLAPAPAGGPPPRRQFRLPEEDEAYLNSLNLRWDAIQTPQGRWILVHDHPLPVGYVTKTTTVAIRIDGGYPPGALDMANFFPPLARADGKALIKVSMVRIDDADYQQWSRHYTWRDDVDTLATHHLHVTNWLEAELKR
jgi:hypothetical protein